MALPRSGKKQAAQHIAIYSVGSIIRQLAGFIMLPIYTSYLTPSDYGVVGLLVVMISLFELVIGARFAQAVPKFYYESSAHEWQATVVSTALLVTLTISALATGLVALSSKPIAAVLFGSVDYHTHVALYCVLLLTSAIEAYGLTFLRLKEKPILFVTNSIAKLVIQLALNILFVVHYEMGVMGVIYSALLSSFIVSIWIAAYIIFNTGIKFSPLLTKRLFRFSWPLWLAGIAGLYVASSNRYFIRIFSDLEQVGLYELATKFAMILPMLIWNPFSQWWQTERFKLYQSKDKGVSVFPVVFDGIVSVMVVMATLISIACGPILRLMADEAFYPSVGAVPILVFSILISNLRFFFFFSFLVTEKTVVITYIKYGSAALATVLYVALIPRFGFIGAAVSVFVTEFVVLIVAFLGSRRFFDNGIKLTYAASLVGLGVAVAYLDYHLNATFTSVIGILISKITLAILLFVAVCSAVYMNKPLRSQLFQLKNELFPLKLFKRS